MRSVIQLVGFLLAVAGAVVVTRSGWPLVAGGLLLLVVVEVPGLVEAVSHRRELRRLVAVHAKLNDPVRDVAA